MRKRITELTNVNVNGMSAAEIVNTVVLPRIVYPTGQDIRGWRIGDDFMNLMADFAPDFYHADSYTAIILLEIAMQRLSCGAVLHDPTPVLDALPNGYKQYSSACDQPGLMSNGCWNFIRKQAAFCLSIPQTRDHMTKIIFGLYDHLDKNGNELYGFTLGGSDFKTSGKEVFDFATQTIGNLTFQEQYEHFATPNRYMRNKEFFRNNWQHIDKKDLAQRLNIKGFFKEFKTKRAIFNN
ncbi:MAG: hypothetical protein IJW72_02575 [Alphaproteobacteria bacterium]|nr:hypothetical protein [Alphaproteobacteria bacterium]